MDFSDVKYALRREARLARNALSREYIAHASELICARLTALPAYARANTVFCFVGVNGEIDTRPFLTRALADGKRVCAPRCARGGRMLPCEIERLDALVPGAFGIPAPSASAQALGIDAIQFTVVPCLYASSSGARLGNGGGYYDRFLAAYAGYSVIVCPDHMIRDSIPTETHDRRASAVLTECAYYENGILTPFPPLA